VVALFFGILRAAVNRTTTWPNYFTTTRNNRQCM